jgi:ketosteroid isomerase-like protein
MSDRDEILATVLPYYRKAIDAAHNGDPTLFVEQWSTQEPVTLFGAVASGIGGWAAVTQAMGSVAARFSNGTPLDFELVAAEVSGELAYLVGYERSSFAVDGGPVEANTLRVTHIYRREDGAWKLVHRHGDPGPGGNPAVDRFQANPGRPPQAPQ